MKKLILLLLLLPFALFANVAKVVAFSGEATIVRGDENIKVTSGIELLKSDVIKTSDNTKLQLIFKDETVVTIGKNSEFKINDYIFDEEQNNYNANLGLMQGTFRTITGKIGKVAPNKFKLNSKSASIGIRGTQILSNVELSGDTIYCTEGAIEITSQLTGETIQIQAGQFVQIKEDEPIVVQEFSLEDIDTIETETQFTSQEEKEQVLESFGVEVEQVEPLEQATQETQEDNNQPLLSEVNDNSNTINESDTYDSIIEKTNNTTTTKTQATFGVIYGMSGSDYLGSDMFSSQTDNKMLFKEDDININLKLESLSTKFANGGSYTGSLSAVGTLNISGDEEDTFSFLSGSYESKENSYNGSTAEFDNNDDIQWGTWNASFKNDGFETANINKAYWLTGEQTAVSEIQALINNETIANYSGYALGTGDNGDFDASNTTVTFEMNFGAQSLTGTFNLNPASINVNGSLTTSGFTFSPDTGTGSGNGKFFGSNANSVGGSFHLNDGNYDYTGVFKAKKQ